MSKTPKLKLACARLADGNIATARELFEWVTGGEEFEQGFRDGLSGLGKTGASEQYAAGNQYGSELFYFRRNNPTQPVPASLGAKPAPNCGVPDCPVCNRPSRDMLKPGEIAPGVRVSAYDAAQDQVNNATDAELGIVSRKLEGGAPEIPEGFTRWEGGERPFDGAVQVVYRGLATPIGGTIDSRGLRWTHLDRASDIIAYKVIEAPAETPPPPSEPQSQAERCDP